MKLTRRKLLKGAAGVAVVAVVAVVAPIVVGGYAKDGVFKAVTRQPVRTWIGGNRIIPLHINMKQLSEQVIKPAMIELADQINFDLYSGVLMRKGTE